MRPRLPAIAEAIAVLAVCGAGVLASVALLDSPRAVPRRATDQPRAVGTQPATRGPLESMFQDDQLLIYSTTATVTRTLDQLAALGVDRLRLTILWSAIAPDPAASTPPPHFDAGRPAAYPPAAWAPYDRVVALARARGIGVDFDLTAPGPRWAMAPGAPQPSQRNHFAPSAAAFGRFVLAVGRRYSGRYVAPGSTAPLPRVAYWSIWNEPNQPGWLAPQWVSGRAGSSGPVLASARLYRGYVDAATAALRLSGHGGDTILIGELAPEGDERPGEASPVAPMPFLRAMYCVGASYAPLRGAAARALGCPASGSAAAFAAAHPGLFAATGFAHHPYSFFLAPAASMSDPNFVPLADLGRLEQGLDRIFTAYSVRRQIPIYLTEYGYETNPPNPFRGVSPATQAADLDEAQYLAWLDPRVRTLSQFLLRDAAPNRAFRRGTVRYWSTFQTGLEYGNGRPKPSLRAYRLPVFLPQPAFAAGGAVGVWAMVRAAPNATGQPARIQWRPAHGAFRTLAVVRTTGPDGILVATVRPPGTGAIRVLGSATSTGSAGRGGGGATVSSRAVAVTETAAP